MRSIRLGKSCRIKITAGKSLRELSCCAFSDIRKLFVSDGELIPVMESDDDAAVSVRECGGAV